MWSLQERADTFCSVLRTRTRVIFLLMTPHGSRTFSFLLSSLPPFSSPVLFEWGRWERCLPCFVEDLMLLLVERFLGVQCWRRPPYLSVLTPYLLTHSLLSFALALLATIENNREASMAFFSTLQQVSKLASSLRAPLNPVSNRSVHVKAFKWK